MHITDLLIQNNDKRLLNLTLKRRQYPVRLGDRWSTIDHSNLNPSDAGYFWPHTVPIVEVNAGSWFESLQWMDGKTPVLNDLDVNETLRFFFFVYIIYYHKILCP